MDWLDAVVYINLDRRVDRREQIESVLDDLGVPPEKIHRFSAIPCEGRAWFGCTMSHRDVLGQAKASGWNTFLVLEDDFEPTVDTNTFITSLRRVFEANIAFDVLFLSHHVIHKHPFPEGDEIGVGRTTCAQTASGYIVKGHFVDRLLTCLEEAVEGGSRSSEHWNYVNDQYWKRLQTDLSTTWLFMNPRLGKQRASYSDLTLQYVDYNV